MTTAQVRTVPRVLHVEQCMGTVFTLDIRTPGRWDDVIADAVRELHRIDAVFSTYREDSDLNRLNRRDITLAEADPDVRAVLALCAQIETDTDGHFSPRRAGRLDPTGLVKGWAVEHVSRMLNVRGAHDHCVNGGGDVQTAGGSAPGVPWRIGIVDPHDRRRVLRVVDGHDVAVATSSTAERGAHITDPFTGRPATAFASASVVGPSLTLADAYATACFVMGPEAHRWIRGRPAYRLLTVDPSGRVIDTS